MTDCRAIRNLKRTICIGGMDRLVTLKRRAIGTPTGDSPDYSEGFSPLADVWANIVSLSRGPAFFDGTNVLRQATHVFGIRYRDDLDIEIWVEYESSNYDVLNIEDLEERRDFMFLYAMKRGDDSIKVNRV